jgi:hypothetical protein
MQIKISAINTSNGLHIPAKIGSGLQVSKNHRKRRSDANVSSNTKTGYGVNELSNKLNLLNLKQARKSNIKFIL